MVEEEFVRKILLHGLRKLLDRFYRNGISRYNGLEVTIISNNCIGGVIYSDFGLRFNSPTINLFFFANDYIRFLKALDHYLTTELIEVEESHYLKNVGYPVGVLDDVEIHLQKRQYI